MISPIFGADRPVPCSGEQEIYGQASFHNSENVITSTYVNQVIFMDMKEVARRERW